MLMIEMYMYEVWSIIITIFLHTLSITMTYITYLSSQQLFTLSFSLIIFWLIELRKTNPLKQVEFVEKLDFCKEFSCPIYPDTTVLEDITFRGLLFSIY